MSSECRTFTGLPPALVLLLVDFEDGRVKGAKYVMGF